MSTTTQRRRRFVEDDRIPSTLAIMGYDTGEYPPVSRVRGERLARIEEAYEEPRPAPSLTFGEVLLLGLAAVGRTAGRIVKGLAMARLALREGYREVRPQRPDGKAKSE